MYLDIRKISRPRAKAIELLLGKRDIRKSVQEILSCRCMVAFDKSGDLISLAQAPYQNQCDIIYFQEELGKKQKSEIKVAFTSVIFSLHVWKREIENNGFGRYFPSYQPGGRNNRAA